MRSTHSEVPTLNCMVLRQGTFSGRAIVKCLQNIRCVLTESPLKNKRKNIKNPLNNKLTMLCVPLLHGYFNGIS
ncbi:hypothetical protein B7P43_G06940 [Cryptotermes secundus]|uniref:Uncharacterized protein n=1 Tax=Cryptotermes secundus TaxID=105785 RepID=A0A2J7PNY4_9NEOP|nr:hypothetical protein B7P43_G06940 [Cryptotermes secundus]